jgi:L-cysteine S-thiosulfotransferase
MKTKTKVLACAVAALAVAGCAGMMESKPAVSYERTQAVLKSSFKERGQAKLDRLEQDDLQRACSDAAASGQPLAKDVAERLEKAQQAAIKYPSGSMLGDWKAGEKIAQTGTGFQYSDDPKNPAGGNCYACHQLTKQELAFGTIGPSLYNFGKIRGFTPDIQKYAYSKVYNSQAFSACSNMPRFGHKGILTEQQIKDVVALLMDPESPVNK